ncbi:MAG: hypothetical protein B7Y25_06985 [Alphaproteobacteria bacterium 16-39-46]|nr:MAG: hypothetical protein B7Y25_06985 [Alphaproteobacteria bacterium 16-39-46]OZA41984.1 MAG: hypothetical protein B7X84_07100 [Alphaproteobacteria bacterium 17-39-52]
MMAKDVKERINIKGKGWIFSAMDFTDIAPRNVVDQTLGRLSKRGDIRKLSTGLYDVPLINQKFGILPPNPDRVAEAIAKKFGYQIQVTPTQAAHDLGLSQQIPAQPVYLTDGLSKVIKVGNQTLRFIRVSHKKMLGVGTKVGIIIQALYYFGQDKINDTIFIKKICSLLNDQDKKALLVLIPRAPLWMQYTLKKIVQNV